MSSSLPGEGSSESQFRYFDPRIHVLDIVFTTAPLVDIPLIPFLTFKDFAPLATQEKRVFKQTEIDQFNQVYNSSFFITYTWTVLPLAAKENPREVKVGKISGPDFTPASYTPTVNDIGHVIKLFCTIRTDEFTPEWILLHRSMTIESAPVLRFPPSFDHQQTPARDYGAIGRNKPHFTVTTYNMLNDVYSHTIGTPFTTSWMTARTFKKRKQLQELLDAKPDILCLQECQEKDYQHIFGPRLGDAGYDGFFSKKESQFDDNWVDGCALMCRTELFNIVYRTEVRLYDRLRQIFSEQQCNSMHIKPPGPVAQLAVLRWNGGNTMFHVILANIHLSTSRYLVATSCALAVFFQTLLQLLQSRQLDVDDTPIIFGGDFNCTMDGEIYKILRTGKIDITKQGYSKVRSSLRNNPQLPLDFDSLKLFSALADVNAPRFEDPLYTNVSIFNPTPCDYVFYRGKALLPISGIIPSLEKMKEDMLRHRASTISEFEIASPNELNASDHEMITVHFVMDQEAMEQRQNELPLGRTVETEEHVMDKYYYRRQVINLSSPIMDESGVTELLTFQHVITKYKAPFEKRRNNPEFLKSLSEQLAVIVYSRLLYEHGLTANYNDGPSNIHGRKERDFEYVCKAINEIISRQWRGEQGNKHHKAFMAAVITNANALDSKTDSASDRKREAKSQKLFNAVRYWLAERQRISVSVSLNNFKTIECSRTERTYSFPRCDANACIENNWHLDGRSQDVIQAELNNLNNEMKRYTETAKENCNTYQSLLLHIFSRREGEESGQSDRRYAPRQATVEAITDFIYADMLSTFKKMYSVAKYPGVVQLEDIGLADKLRKQIYEQFRKAWLANQIKAYWCQTRPEPYETFERILRMTVSGTQDRLLKQQIIDQEVTLRNFLFINLRFSVLDPNVNFAPRISRTAELPCFGLENPNMANSEKPWAKALILGVENNEVGLNQQLTETTDFLFY